MSNILTWKPTPRQAAFLAVPDTVFEVMYGGAAGGGKSEALLNLPIVREFFKHPRFKGICFRRTYPELEAELIVRSDAQGLYRGTGATYNKDKKRWQWPSGAIMQFGHLEYDSDVRKYDSAEYNLVEFDELTSFTKYQYLYMFSRCRSSDPNLPSIVRSGTNPGNVGHSWVRERFVEPCSTGNVILTDTKTTLSRIFIPSKVQDNPYLMKNDPQYINRLQGMAEKDRRAKLDGDWYTFSGQVFDDYRETQYEGEPENAVHVVDEFEIPSWWPRILSIDWGYEALTYALWSAIAPNGRVYLYREYAVKHAKISQWATDIGRISHGEQFTDVVICQSAGQQRGDDLTIAEQFEKYSGMRPRLSVNEHGSRVASKLLLQDYFRWRAKPTRKIPSEGYDHEKAGQILRTQGMKVYQDYLESFEPEKPEENLPKIQIFRSLEVLRKTIPLCVYDDDHKEDVAEFDGDDPYDCLRYNIRAVDSLSLTRSKEKFENFQNIDKAVKSFEQTKDWTSYYRKMEKLEHTAIRSVRPIRRHRRAA